MRLRLRTVGTAYGPCSQVPSLIVRIDQPYAHGWQLRHGPSCYFADPEADAAGAARSLALASTELRRRIDRLPAPSRLKSGASRSKRSDLPVGISGPVVRLRPGRRSEHYYLQVTYPVFGRKPANRSVYIATSSTFDATRLAAAIDKARAMRQAGLRQFRQAATRDLRRQAERLLPAAQSAPSAARPRSPATTAPARTAATHASAPP